LEKPLRSSGGHRLYPEHAVTTLRAIKAAQRLGFTLKEVIGQLDTMKHRHKSSPFRDAARSKLDDIESRIADLQVVAVILRESLAAVCTDLESCAAADECPIPFRTLTQP
jgi:MerR family mercuric resistance operon transcriptional regulator